MAHPKKKMGEEEKAKVLLWIEKGLLSRTECCERLDIDIATLLREMKRDPEFKKKVEETEFLAHDELVTAMYHHAHTKDYRAAWTLLTRKWQKKWGQAATYSTEEMLKMALQFSELIKKFVPENQQLDFAKDVEDIIEGMERGKKQVIGDD